MRKMFHLGTCSTCQRIIKSLPPSKLEYQDIKTDPITPAQLDQMKKLAGSYEALFSRRAMKYRSMGLADKKLTEKDYRRLILEEYTFLRRPVVVLNDQIFIGNSKKVVEATQSAL